MTVLDFSPPVPGRTVDVLVFHTPDPFTMRTTTQKLLGNLSGGVLCTGIQKLAQQVVLRLFTKTGGKPYATAEGVQLVTEILQQRIKTVRDVRRSFAQSRLDLLAQFDNDVRTHAGVPADERLVDIRLINAVIARNEVYLSLEVTSGAGDSLQFTVPVTAS